MTDMRAYGSALFSIAKEEGLQSEIYEQLKRLKTLLDGEHGLFDILDTPALSLDERLCVIDRCFCDFHPYITNMLKMLTERFSSYQADNCIQAYFDENDESENLLRATAVTASPMSERQKEALTKKLSALTNKNVILTNELDIGVLGGVVLRYGGVQLDGSVKTRLEELRKKLSGTIV